MFVSCRIMNKSVFTTRTKVSLVFILPSVLSLWAFSIGLRFSEPGFDCVNRRFGRYLFASGPMFPVLAPALSFHFSFHEVQFLALPVLLIFFHGCCVFAFTMFWWNCPFFFSLPVGYVILIVTFLYCFQFFHFSGFSHSLKREEH